MPEGSKRKPLPDPRPEPGLAAIPKSITVTSADGHTFSFPSLNDYVPDRRGRVTCCFWKDERRRDEDDVQDVEAAVKIKSVEIIVGLPDRPDLDGRIVLPMAGAAALALSQEALDYAEHALVRGVTIPVESAGATPAVDGSLLYLVGRMIEPGSEMACTIWEFLSVQATQEAAIAACSEDRDFYVPVIVGHRAPEETTIWPGVVYPRR
jgi:hypothetical protein